MAGLTLVVDASKSIRPGVPIGKGIKEAQMPAILPLWGDRTTDGQGSPEQGESSKSEGRT